MFNRINEELTSLLDDNIKKITNFFGPVKSEKVLEEQLEMEKEEVLYKVSNYRDFETQKRFFLEICDLVILEMREKNLKFNLAFSSIIGRHDLFYLKRLHENLEALIFAYTIVKSNIVLRRIEKGYYEESRQEV